MRKEKTKRFHQFVRIERGPVNAAIIDLLTGNLFQVPVEVIDTFDSGDCRDIEEFVQVAREEKLIIEIDPGNWIPGDEFETELEANEIYDVGIELHVEEGVDLDNLLGRFKGYAVDKVYFYGQTIPKTGFNGIEIESAEKNFEQCVRQATKNGDFCKTRESVVRFNLRYNSCWGTVIAVTADGKIRPCIHSRTAIGDIDRDLDNIAGLLETFKPFWTCTKDKVKKCRDCELRHICFDCREIPMRHGKRMDAPNPLCGYNPYSGKWET